MFGSGKAESCVRPTRFKSINEDEQNYCQNQPDQWRRSKRSNKCPRDNINMTNTDYKNESVVSRGKNRIPSKPNFSLEYSYPTVILEDVCFTVDKSQQQSNFLNECLFRLNQCINPLCASDNDQDHNSKVQILKSVNLSVPNGTIFGLLGPSSCGKTTLLRCLVGLLKLNSGSIRLFGNSSFSKPAESASKHGLCSPGYADHRGVDCKVPGSNVGYMPQDLGLYEDFTITQLLTMFGNYMRMDSKLIKARIKFMANFLELPDVNREIQTLSGGQKRRVSFAIACLHMPPLIILDEPTVGVDPLLRRSIWKYLRRLASEEKKTIIITTHYIEEAAQADQVAFMRAGEILVQDSPSNIIRSNNSRTLEEAFLKICNNVQSENCVKHDDDNNQKLKIIVQPQFHWPNELDKLKAVGGSPPKKLNEALSHRRVGDNVHDSVIQELELRAREKVAIYDKLRCNRLQQQTVDGDEQEARQHPDTTTGDDLSMEPGAHKPRTHRPRTVNQILEDTKFDSATAAAGGQPAKRGRMFNRNKFVLNDHGSHVGSFLYDNVGDDFQISSNQKKIRLSPSMSSDSGWRQQISKSVNLFWALLYKNYRRNVNSIPLLAFQFILPMLQMVSFSLCVGGKPTNVGLGIVNRDKPINFLTTSNLADPTLHNVTGLFRAGEDNLDDLYLNDSLSLRYISFIDTLMLNIKFYDDLDDALADVRRAKLWAVLEIGENFTVSIAKRYDIENFYQLDLITIHQSVIRIYPDRSNKILDMICHRSLVDSYRKFLSDEFVHLKRLPIEIARPIFDIKPNVISNSIDGYTESIAPGLLASLTYIMAAGLTTFIMVVERSAGILERTYTSGINPVSYLLAHALFRSVVMMIQIAFVLILTFYVLHQPLVGSIWLAYLMLMILNVTGISYGLLISSIVTDQNGAALTIVSSLVVKITLSGILWPFEAIPHWLRTICYIQPLTMPVQALKAITLKGATLGDRAVNLGFLVSISWLIIFLTISAKRFKFYQH